MALSIAGALAIFLLYTAIAGQGTATIKPSQLTSRTGRVQIVGTVIGPVTGSPYSAGGQHFRMRDIGGKVSETVSVVYRGDEGTLFRHVAAHPRHGQAPERRVRRRPRLDADQVPLEVPAEEELLTLDA